jgi:hypothetical protein
MWSNFYLIVVIHVKISYLYSIGKTITANQLLEASLGTAFHNLIGDWSVFNDGI